MLHSRPTSQRRPALLALVFGVMLVLIGLTASAVVGITGVHLSNSTLEAVVSRDGSLVELFVNGTLRRTDLEGSVSGVRSDEIERAMATLTDEDEILRMEIRDAHGAVRFAASPAGGVAGDAAPRLGADELAAASEGRAAATLVDGETAASLGTGAAVAELLPVLDSAGSTLALVAVWRDAAPIQARVADAQRDVVIVLVAAGVVLSLMLFLLFRASHARLGRQQAALIEAERRDPLTGLLNHGTAVGLLSEAAEAARDGRGIGVALVDIDNFRLFNEIHGHEAADEVLLQVATTIEGLCGAATVVARYGPDEFLLAEPGASLEDLRIVAETLRARLSELSIRFGDSEELPITVSVGIATYPADAGSVTDLLSTAAVAIAEARAGGGDAVRGPHADPEAEEGAVPAGFGLFTGLVIAVDTKDRYTKRHSEDVARYASFLAGRLGLDEELRRTAHLAGLLHDVGKIGIPDAILRKPAKLTADEYDAFKQHVALGDAIVRDVPNVELVRAGIRHHHERWDGGGYLDGLEGEGIPLIARILAVADAFSAMTTTRPYRKALPLEEAIDRLGDAAGTQLEEPLVVAFLDGLRIAPDAPLPGSDAGPIWIPERWVA